MSRILVLLVLAIALGYGALSFYYGSPEPCRMLAQERAYQAADAMGVDRSEVDSEGLIGQVGRMSTSNMTTGECVDELWRAWFD